jgi:hypothetical protein
VTISFSNKYPAPGSKYTSWHRTLSDTRTTLALLYNNNNNDDDDDDDDNNNNNNNNNNAIKTLASLAQRPNAGSIGGV